MKNETTGEIDSTKLDDPEVEAAMARDHTCRDLKQQLYDMALPDQRTYAKVNIDTTVMMEDFQAVSGGANGWAAGRV